VKPIRDPEGAELKHLVDACDMSGKQVLEIGCGDGTFTRQYAHLASGVIGIDPLISEVQIARGKARSASKNFAAGKGEELPFPSQVFDIAIFASSL
jgi:ubiquinone/menaquinone biosynthesis C-methylase UbiE